MNQIIHHLIMWWFLKEPNSTLILHITHGTKSTLFEQSISLQCSCDPYLRTYLIRLRSRYNNPNDVHHQKRTFCSQLMRRLEHKQAQSITTFVYKCKKTVTTIFFSLIKLLYVEYVEHINTVALFYRMTNQNAKFKQLIRKSKPIMVGDEL